MTDTVLISLIGAGATVILATVNGVFALLANARAKRNEEHLLKTKDDVAVIKTQTDDMTERGEALAKKVGMLEGHAQGMADAGTVPVMLVPQPEPEAKTVRSLLHKPTGK